MNSNDTTFIGMDVHKNEHKVAMILPGADQPITWSVVNKVRQLKAMAKKIKKQSPGEVIVAYESGVCGFGLQRQLNSYGLDCKVIAASLVPGMPGDHVKTDRRDALKIMRCLKADMLTEVFPPNEKQEGLRDLCRCRDAALIDLNRIKHQLSKFVLRYGYNYTGGKQWTETHMQFLHKIKFENEVAQIVFAEYLCELSHRNERLKVLTSELEKIALSDEYKEIVGALCCFRGIKEITAINLIAELFAFGRFPEPRKLMSYLGLTPSEDSSGEKQKRGSITKAGNKRIRRLLIQAGWHQRHKPTTSKDLAKRRQGQPEWVVEIAKRAQKRLHKKYWHLVNNGKRTVKAVTAVAREMVGFIWDVLWTFVELGK